MRTVSNLAYTLILTAVMVVEGRSANSAEPLGFAVQTDVPLRELSEDFCWFHPRAAAIPGAFGSGGWSTTPRPGWTRLPARSPIASATKVISQK